MLKMTARWNHSSENFFMVLINRLMNISAGTTTARCIRGIWMDNHSGELYWCNTSISKFSIAALGDYIRGAIQLGKAYITRSLDFIASSTSPPALETDPETALQLLYNWNLDIGSAIRIRELGGADVAPAPAEMQYLPTFRIMSMQGLIGTTHDTRGQSGGGRSKIALCSKACPTMQRFQLIRMEWSFHIVLHPSVRTRCEALATGSFVICPDSLPICSRFLHQCFLQ
jgi:hypothetical protein